MSRFDTILMANRGEIACRIMRTIREMGLHSVAVYSDADAEALHVQLADQAVHIGASPAAESYLVIDKIINAAKQSGAQAIHPGYGFLSENAEFAKACAEAGLTFIGPSAEAISLMGDKAVAKRRMIAAGVPCVPGYQDAAQSDAQLIKASKDIGFPLMVKAAAGGGGRGMRLVTDAAALPDAIRDARAEAKSAFGADDLILERAVQNPRHVEIQIFADAHGTTLHLGERDCSVQRRLQKVIEESPCPVMTPSLRARMGEAAVQAAQSVDYVGAGTVEFLLDDVGAFYFLEMNTRLQVEHPVTEMVTGLDLVALQIQVAQGLPLSLSQDDISLNGHAIEARLYAEDPTENYRPATGGITQFSVPDMTGVRVDSGIAASGTVSPFYDPMLAKIIAHGPDRDTARRRLIRALEETVLFGVTNNRAHLIDILSHDRFAAGEATTAFLPDYFPPNQRQVKTPSAEQLAITAVIQFQLARDKSAASVPSALLNWASASPIRVPFIYGEQHVYVTPTSRHQYRVSLDKATHTVDCLSRVEGRGEYRVNSTRHNVQWHATDGKGEISVQFGRDNVTLTNAVTAPVDVADAVGAGDIVAPMHGVLTEVFVTVGQSVTRGQRLCILEAMKMQHEILAEIDGTVTELSATAGTQVPVANLLMKITASDAPPN